MRQISPANFERSRDESEAVDGLAKPADFDVHVLVPPESFHRRGPAGNSSLSLPAYAPIPTSLPRWSSTIFVSGNAPARFAGRPERGDVERLGPFVISRRTAAACAIGNGNRGHSLNGGDRHGKA
jgi:hypothetical protein